MALSKVDLRNILSQKESKLPKRQICPKRWKKFYEEIMSHLENFTDELYDELKKNKKKPSKPDDISSDSSKLDVTDIDPIRAYEISSKDIKDMVNSMTIPEDEANMIVEKIKADLNNTLRKYGFTENQWRVYGSFDTGLRTIDSDIDFYYENINHVPGAIPENSNIQKRISRCLKKTSNLFSGVKYIPSARVPIIELTHKETERDIDISFCESGIKSSLLTKFYVQLNPSVKYLTLFLKLLLKKCKIYGTNRITSHIIFWLVVFFLQRRNMLPAVKKVRKEYDDCAKSELFENWNCSLNEEIDHSYESSTRNLPILLLGFAKFYKYFDFAKNVISPYLADVIPIDEINEWEIPDEIFPSNNNDGKNTFYRHVINIQEPTILSSNLAKNVGCKVLNLFVTFCDKLLSTKGLLTSKGGIKEEDIPRDLHRFVSTTVSLSNLNNTNSEKSTEMLCRAVHRAMNGVLNFQLETMTTEEVIQVEFNKHRTYKYKTITVPVIYMNYLSTEKTWSNINVEKVLSFPKPPAKSHRSVEVYLICEIYPLKREARILIQTDRPFSRFLQKFAREMFKP